MTTQNPVTTAPTPTVQSQKPESTPQPTKEEIRQTLKEILGF